MTVRAILAEKGRHVVTASASTSICEIARMLSSNHIGAVVIVNAEYKTVGIVTERDIVSHVARRGEGCFDEAASTIMWRNVYCCSQATSINSAMGTMNRLRARHLPVEENGRLAGIISIGDVVRHHIRAIEYETESILSYIAS